MALKETLCPECNEKMVSRNGKYGTFWGCSKFPACKGTRDSMGRSKAEREEEKALEEDTEWKKDNDKYRFRKQ